MVMRRGGLVVMGLWSGDEEVVRGGGVRRGGALVV